MVHRSRVLKLPSAAHWDSSNTGQVRKGRGGDQRSHLLGGGTLFSAAGGSSARLNGGRSVYDAREIFAHLGGLEGRPWVQSFWRWSEGPLHPSRHCHHHNRSYGRGVSRNALRHQSPACRTQSSVLSRGPARAISCMTDWPSRTPRPSVCIQVDCKSDGAYLRC